jgi:PD-(D/E)XK endonuclease
MGRAFSFAQLKDGSHMDKFKFFKNFKERGEWVELCFMVAALRHGYKVLTPWGESSPFDVALYFGNRIVRVQVKSTSYRKGTGYLCHLRSGPQRPYTLDNIDFFAGYVVPQDVWYLIPAPAVIGKIKKGLMVCPMQRPKVNRYRYECYREAWPLLRPKPEEKKPR